MPNIFYQKQGLGVAFKEARKKAKKTQSELAQSLQVSIPTIRNLEKGAGQLITYRRALDLLGLDLSGWWHREDHAHLGITVSTLRKQRGMSQRALARSISVSHPTICNLEKTGNCRIDIFEQIFKTLNYSLWIGNQLTHSPINAISQTTSIKYFSLFSGIGGFDLAIETTLKKTVPVVLVLPKSTARPSASTTATSRRKILAIRYKYRQKIFQNLNSWSQGFLAKHFQSLERGSVSRTRAVRSFLKLRGLFGQNNHVFFCLKTSKGFYHTTTGAHSTLSSSPLMNWGTTFNGKCLTARISGFRKTASGCSLSDILEEHPDRKYFLSEKMQRYLIERANQNKDGHKPKFHILSEDQM